jgi:uncharacterized protein (TIGR02996 family)
MSEEQSFLEQLKENPADDGTRLVYADWLEDHGQPALAAYIRLELELAAMEPDEPGYTERDAELRRRRLSLDLEKVNQVGRGYDLILMRYERVLKIRVIKVIRELAGCSLLEAKNLSETVPSTVCREVSRYEAEIGREKFSQLGSVEAVICLSPTAGRPSPQPLPARQAHAVVFLACETSDWAAVVDAIQETKDCTRGEAESILSCWEPTTIRVFPTEEQARQAAVAFDKLALIGIWPVKG